MLGRKSFLILMTNVVGAMAGLVGNLVIGRFVGPEPFGMFKFALSLVGIGSFLAKMGFDAAHVKRVSEGKHLGACNGTFASIKFGLVGGFAIAALVAAWAWDTLRGFTDATTFSLIAVAVLYVSAMQLRSIPEITFNALTQTARTQMLNLVEHLFKFPILILGAVVYGFLRGDYVPFAIIPATIAGWFNLVGPVTKEFGAMLIAGSWALAMVVSMLVGFWMLRRYDLPFDRFDRATARSYLAFAIPVAALSAMTLIRLHTDAIMLGYFWQATDVGLYGMAQSLTAMILVIPTAIRTLFFPMISELSTKGHTGAVLEVAHSTQRALSLIMTLFVMFMVVYPAEGLHIFVGDSFLGSAHALQLLATYTAVLALTTVSSSIVMGYDKPKIVATIGTISILSNLVLNFVFIPSSVLGIPLLGLKSTGAALATLLSQVLSFVALAIVARRMTGSFLVGSSVMKHVAAAVIVGLFLFHGKGLPIFFGIDRVWELLWCGVVGTVLYLGLLTLLRDVGRKDILLVLDIVHPLKMMRYVRDEAFTRGGHKQR